MGCHCENCGAELPFENLWLCNDCIREKETNQRISEAEDRAVRRAVSLIRDDINW